ncbi:uncharacterized protein LOC105693970 [Athalia rosae]|uniref:uncharacterized protein LOC105693970 n=1 Tax=Athalia rosae TaxID=37344 RepID=UPI002033E8A0|nr:uncharacterized protein LOC105693970 [Athalia rosae]
MSAAKRPRVASSTSYNRQPNLRRTQTLDTLPPEVLEMVLRLLPLCEVAQSVRLVSQRCLIVSTSVLNAAFLTTGVRLEETMSYVEANMPRVTTESELLACSRAFNALELVRAQYRMLRAVTWRYTHPPRRENPPKLCFYAGTLLDELDRLLRVARARPLALGGMGQNSEFGVGRFVSLCKRFMNYFEKVSERRVNKSALVSGCKAVDVLDCLAEGRHVLAFRISSERGGYGGSAVCMRLRYVMRRAWFTCLEVPTAPDENSWRDEQRFMYLRLRRLVGSVNDHLFEKSHYDRERLLRSPALPSPRAPPASTYSGYGEYGGQFFYYGNMNKYAFESKFKTSATGDWEDPENPEDPENLDDADDLDDERGGGSPCFDLVVGVELRCSPELAPLAVRAALRLDDLENSTAANSKQELYLRLNVVCPASVTNRLPGNFTWELKAPRRGRMRSS